MQRVGVHRIPHSHTWDYRLVFSLRSQEAQAYSDENGLFFMETSAKTAVNVNELFYEIARKLPKAQPFTPGGGAGIVLNNNAQVKNMAIRIIDSVRDKVYVLN
jgi:hypothetical protein